MEVVTQNGCFSNVRQYFGHGRLICRTYGLTGILIRDIKLIKENSKQLIDRILEDPPKKI